MSRYFDQNQNTVQFGDSFIPLEDFTKLSNSPKTELVTQISDFVTNLADIQFSEKVLALYSAYIIYQDYQFGLVNPQDVRRLNLGVKYLVFFSSRSLKKREKYISFAQ